MTSFYLGTTYVFCVISYYSRSRKSNVATFLRLVKTAVFCPSIKTVYSVKFYSETAFGCLTNMNFPEIFVADKSSVAITLGLSKHSRGVNCFVFKASSSINVCSCIFCPGSRSFVS